MEKNYCQKKQLLSAVVCTYNRCGLLQNLLESMCAQSMPKERLEVIVVDNNSTDNTLEMAYSFEKKFLHYRVLQESQQGPSHARNKGWREAKGEYVAFIDDDAKVPSDWMANVFAVIEAQTPDVLGGPIYPYYETEKPLWFKDEYEIRLIQNHSGWLAEGHLSGSNMIFRRELFDEMGGFDTDYGMTAGRLSYGEDTEIIKRARAQGKKIYYSLDIAVQHHVPQHKMDLFYAMTAAFRNGKATSDLWWGGDAPLEMLPAILDSLFAKLDESLDASNRNKERYPFRENYIYENCFADITSLGAMVGYAEKYGYAGQKLFEIVKGRLKKRWKKMLG